MVAKAEANDATSEEDETPEPGRSPAEEAEAAPRKTQRRRRRVSKDTPRERRDLDPGDACPDCGGDLHVMPEACLRHDGQDVSERFDMLAARIKVIHVRQAIAQQSAEREIARVETSCIRRANAPSGAFAVPPHRRAHGPGARPRPADPAQHGGARPVGLPPPVRVRRSRSALTPERPERRPRRGDEGAAPADRGDRGRRHDQPDPARPSRQHGFAMRLPGNGRHAHPRARPIPKGHWPRKGREAGTRPGPCPRSATPVRRRAARLRLPLLPGSTANGTCVATSREVGRPSAG